MKFCSIASGSSGNAYYVGVGDDHFLFDAGVSGKYIEHSLYDINVRKISGIFITHEHRDHAKGAGIFARKFNTSIYATPLTWRYFLENNVLGKIPEEQKKIIEPEKPITIGNAVITAFEIPHDAAQPVGYTIETKTEDHLQKIAFATDLGYVTDTVLKHIKGANLLLIESNHDIHMLQTGAYTAQLKERVGGNFGHLSNEATGHLLVQVAHPNLQYVILAHLSKDNNTPEIAQNTITKILNANNIIIENLYIASRNKPSSIISLSSGGSDLPDSSELRKKPSLPPSFSQLEVQETPLLNEAKVINPQSKFTEPQQAAIDCNASAILVSAAAGSGKTAVLTERIVKHISQGISVNDLLIVTFTEAASAEMRERVTNKLNELHKNAKENSKEKAVYAKQISLLPMADISTIHAFCRRLVKEHFQVVNIDPNFRVGDMGELSLIRSQVMNDLFEKEYTREDNADFLDLANVYGGKTMDGRLDQLVRKIFDFMESTPFPLEAAKKYSEKFSTDIIDLDSTPWADVVREELSQGLDGVLEGLRQALELCNQLGGPGKYIPLLEIEYQQVQELQKATKKATALLPKESVAGLFSAEQQCLGQNPIENKMSFSDMYNAFLRFAWEKLPRILEKDNVDPNLKERVQRIRNKAAKDKIKSLVKGVFFAPPNKMQSDLMALAPRVSALMKLATRFSMEYSIEKRARNILDFSDLEHFAIQILYPNGEDFQIREVSKKYYEVLTDEYQDSNKVQDLILSAIAERQFMVGDVKQSIYRFRRAEPELFNEKYNAFSQYDGVPNIGCGGVRIDLSHNFRSHPRVLNAVNFFFSQLMCEQVGEVNYDNAAALHPGFPEDEYGKYPHKDSPQMWIEILDQAKEEYDNIEGAEKVASPFFEENVAEVSSAEWRGLGQSLIEDEEISNVVAETRVIAQCVHELLKTRKVWDKDLKKVRPCKFGDMAILTRGLANSSGEIIEELKKYGIEAIADTTTGFFDQIEIKTVLAFLRITDNPRQDIDLITAMHSPVYGFTPDELLTIRQFPIPTTIVIEEDKKPPIYDFYDHVIAISKYEKDENGLSKKVNNLLSDLETWRKASVYMPISRLIGLIYDTTSYPAYVANMKGGANLRLLLERAIEFEETSLRGLFHFIHYIERLADSDVAESTPSAVEPSSTQENAVRLMTIHKSKGLEFPIIFCSFLGKQFNMDSERQPVIMHSAFGVGPYYVDTELRTRANTLARFSLSRLTRRESLSEELRCLYVALTRAQELLVLTGRCNDLYKSLEKWSDPVGHAEITLPVYYRREAKTYLDWIMPCLLRHKDGAETFDFVEQSIQKLWNHPAKFRIRSHKQELINNLELPELDPPKNKTTTIEIPQPVSATDSFVLSKSNHNKLPSKLSISEIKRLYNITPDATIHNDSAPNFEAPAFIRGKGLTPMQIGSILHTIVEHLDYHRHTTPTTIEELIKDLVTRNFLSEEEATKVNRKKINTLVNSNLADRMRKAKKIYKETPFVLALLANTLYDLPKEQENERILVHGIIDCYFEEDGQIVLLDYKSDAWQGSPQEWANTHKVQMQIYKQALEEATKLRVKEVLLYSFSKDVAVSCFEVL